MAPVIRQKNYGPQNLGHKWGGGVGGEGVREPNYLWRTHTA